MNMAIGTGAMATQKPRAEEVSETHFAGRRPLDWFKRALVGLVLAIAGCYAVTNSLAHVVVKGNPKQAYGLAGSDGRILSAYAEEEFARHPTAKSSSFATKLARKAVAADPTAVDALIVLGFQAQLRGSEAQSNRLFEYTNRLSRRELRAQIWAVEHAVNRGDLEGALRQYDIALRTSFAAQDMLFPTLAAALIEPKIRKEVLRRAASHPVWSPHFVRYLSTSWVEPVGAMRYFLEGRAQGLDVSGADKVALVDALTATNHLSEAWDYYQTFRLTTGRGRSRDPDFRLFSDPRSVFDWSVSEGSGISATIISAPEGGAVQFEVSPSAGGPILRQAQLLPSGRYRLSGRSSGTELPEYARPYWVLRCKAGRELGRIPVSMTQPNGTFSGLFSVPPDCPFQELVLIARPHDAIGRVTGEIQVVELSQVAK